MRNIFYCLVLLVSVSSAVEAIVLDRIVAVVNDDVVTLSELKSLELSVLKREGTRSSREDAALNRERLLDELIDKKIKLQKAEDLKISIADQEVHAAIEQILSQNRITKEAFREKLHKEGFAWADYEKEIRNQIVLSRLVNQEVRSKIVLMPEEIRQYYQDHLDRFGVNEKKQVLRILLSLPDGAGPEEIRSRKQEAEDLRRRVMSGEDFQEVAMRYSDGPEASEGGNLGYFARGDLRADLDEAVGSLSLGAVSPVIDRTEGFIILKVEDIRVASHIPFEKAQDEIKEALYQDKLRERYRAWITELKGKAFIEIKKEALREESLPLSPVGQEEASAPMMSPEPEVGRPSALPQTVAAAMDAPEKAAAVQETEDLPPPSTGEDVAIPAASLQEPPPEASGPAAAGTADDPWKAKMSEWAERIQNMPEGKYAIQVETSGNLDSIRHTLDRLRPEYDVMVVRFRARGWDVYTLLIGVYNSAGQAEKALQELPPHIRAQDPIVRSVAAIRKGMIPK